MLMEKIKKLCKERGISINQVERDLNLSNGSITKWYKSVPKADRLKKVADYFGVSMDYLMGDEP